MRALTIGMVVIVGLLLGIGARPAAAAGPEVRSKAAVVLDARTGAAIFDKGADDVRAIASTTKIFVAMAVRKAGIALEDYTTITKVDADASKGGSRTRLDVGQQFRNIDLLRAMLISSDNRCPTALGRAVGLDAKGLIAAMNEIARDLGLKKTKFTDTSGLRGNVSTAREMALALREALADPVLKAIMSTEFATVTSKTGYAKIVYGNTNVPLRAHKFDVIGGKTGYTRAAGYCFITGATLAGREVMVVVLGADGKLTRFADFDRIATWMEAGASGSKVKVGATATASSASADGEATVIDAPKVVVAAAGTAAGARTAAGTPGKAK
jgi:D-alanyl-D-alanine endopeptidase (penicillin-binding protein 7)